MGTRVAWSEQEALILVDAFYQIKKGLMTKHNAVKNVSDELRQIAISRGIIIDDVFRNLNGISMQMATLEHIYSEGKTGLRSGSKLFREVMKLYSSDPEDFQKRLMEARSVDKEIDNMFDNFLLSHFAYGIKTNSPIELMRFKRFYTEDYGEVCPWSDEVIEKMISEQCFLHEGKGYVINEQRRSEILTKIDGLSESGIQIVYYKDLYEENEEWFYQQGIFSDEMLKGFLQKYSKNVVCKKTYFSWSQGTENELLKRYILDIWGDSILHDYSELKQCMRYVPVDKIKYALANNSCFVWNSAETYTCEDMFSISEEDEKNILKFVEERIMLINCVSFDEIPLETVFDENFELSETAIFSLIYSKILSTDYVKTNRAISRKGSESSVIDSIESFCKSKREITLEELFEQWEIRTGTHRQAEPLEIAYSVMVRVDANRFVTDEQVIFDEASIDNVLDTLINGEAIGLKEITSFALFPDCNFSWNLYLIESFCRRFSKTFKFMTVTTNSRNAGAIVRKECKYEYHTLLAHMLASKEVVLSEDIVMDYLYDNGYIARHSYKHMKELIELASALREGR